MIPDRFIIEVKSNHAAFLFKWSWKVSLPFPKSHPDCAACKQAYIGYGDQRTIASGYGLTAKRARRKAEKHARQAATGTAAGSLEFSATSAARINDLEARVEELTKMAEAA